MCWCRSTTRIGGDDQAAMKKVCKVRLEVTVAALMSTLSVTNAGDVTFAAVLALGLAFWMRPNELP